ncbi:MAG: YigZ family protein [Acidaminococcus sp.]|jgi:uncharacterized YigZ family protein|nr:YigZ family protein [Acidaminococcus sp.]MCI2100398.1 YigZ family protein [Acidaminococcus sp.]MCI2114719.1 YigZ family protein [Acidaminococcus sp.]MCI2116706.1 YigZ family protein [Acidaminococcus sp.]
MDQYIISKPVRTEIVVEKSRFICTLARVASEQEAQDFIKKTRKEFWDATHNCTAYIIGGVPRAERSSDDGEPSGTAGSPMLEVLRKKELYNTAAVVTRYFGGIKLGAGGLTRTYGKAVTEAVKAAGLSKMVPMGHYAFTWSLDDVGRVLNLLYRQSLFAVHDVEYGSRAEIILEMKQAQVPEAEAWLTETLSKPVTLEEKHLFEAEQPVAAGV